MKSVREILKLLIFDPFEHFRVNLKRLHFTEVFGDVVFDVVDIPINLHIQVVGPGRDLPFDSRLVSHKVEFVQALGEHVCPQDGKHFADLRFWEV
jgi:hypothetical protein